ncbi:uncharacterized protein EDB91DRAFT_1199333 [Suillus paluster]|uniref:uncharacterized protein n=1 Tax=Suillus paluster TaxID=48578 RepID=UPI001B87E072|nr:uncharacterized protein EDB91DRAFT_1199333 [Suillus paluster]KAG1745818.1 hypothetical protein EDB91DRAFT_1199333 [Suillus paluster]
MSLNHPPVIQQSLPSFAQAFSNSSLSSITPSNNALPPIQPSLHQTISPPLSSRQPSLEQLRNSRKRSREEVQLTTRCESTSDSGHNDNDSRQSPRVLRIKEEDDRDDSLISSPSPPPQNQILNESGITINPPSPKKRRVTVSGITHSLNSSTLPFSSDTSHSTPITPVVITIPTGEDVQSRSLQTLKQQPKSLAEQRRGSFAGPPGPSTMLSAAINGTPSSSATYSPPEGPLPAPKLTGQPRLGRRSPNTVARSGGTTLASGSRATLPHPPTPPPMIVPSQQPPALTANPPPAEAPSNPQRSPPSNSLPPPPISFARRRAAQSGNRKRKPADIVISPRGANSCESLAPVIQSAPPVPEFGRFPMALPRLPTALSGSQTTRRVATNVPPTPTRFGLQHTAGPSVNSASRAGTSTRSPPAIPIASSLVPPTPRSLQHPGYSGDKSAFLAPFEVFYDALNDSKQMKNWLSEQLQKSNALLQSLQKVDQVVEDLVERKTRAMQEEMQSMRQRMDSLEEALRAARADSARTHSMSNIGYPQGSKFPQNGMSSSSEPSSSYRFPTTDQRRRVSPPSWGTDKDRGASRSPDTDRRMSISVARLEPSRMMSSDQSQVPYSPFTSTPRSGPVPASNPKGTPPLRSQAVPERTSTHRQADARQTNRMYYPGSYNGGSGDSGATSRANDSHKNPGAMDER